MKRRGISLIVLIITIIVIIILATAIIINLVKTNIVNNANEAITLNNEQQIIEKMKLEISDFFVTYSKEKINLENLAVFLTEKVNDVIITQASDENLILEYMGYEIQIDSEFKVTILGKVTIRIVTSLNPTTYTNSTVDIQLNIAFEDNLELSSVTLLTEGVEVIEENKIYRVSDNGQYKFKILANNGDSRTVSVNVSNIDNIEPQIEIIKFVNECIANEYIDVKYNLSDDIGLNLDNCKYIFNTVSAKYDASDTIWNDATIVSNSSVDIETKFSESGTYYLHILATDIAGNSITYISDKIDVKKEPLYLFNEGAVNGYTWSNSYLASGNTSNISNTYIYFYGTNYSWLGARWELKSVNLSGYTNIYMEVSTGTILNCGIYQSQNYGVSIIGDSYTNTPILYAKTDNLNREVISANLGEYSKANVTLYLIFSRWNPGCYVHKIWVD